MDKSCTHDLMLTSTLLSGPQIVCRACGRRWDVRGKLLADALCWGAELLILAACPIFFGEAAAAFFTYGHAAGAAGTLLTLALITPSVIVIHFGVFALGHALHAAVIRRSGDLAGWRAEDPYHR